MSGGGHFTTKLSNAAFADNISKERGRGTAGNFYFNIITLLEIITVKDHHFIGVSAATELLIRSFTGAFNQYQVPFAYLLLVKLSLNIHLLLNDFTEPAFFYFFRHVIFKLALCKGTSAFGVSKHISQIVSHGFHQAEG